MTTEEQTEQAAPASVGQYLCQGRRWDGKNMSILLLPEGEQRPKWYVENKSTSGLRAGAIYDIPQAPNGSLFIGRRTYKGKADDAADWEALDRAASLAKSAAAREKRDTAANVELLKALLPWRRAYQATNYEGRLALQVQVLASLQRFPGDGDGE